MPLDSKWAKAEAAEKSKSVTNVRPPRSSGKHQTKKLSNHKRKDLDIETSSDADTTDSEWSRPSSNSRSAIFEKSREKQTHTPTLLSENPLAKALGIRLDDKKHKKESRTDDQGSKEHHSKKPTTANHEKDKKKPQGRKPSKDSHESAKTDKGKGSDKGREKDRASNVKKMTDLKQRIDEQKRLLEDKKHKAKQKELIDSFLDGDASFDWEEDETELIQKLA